MSDHSHLQKFPQAQGPSEPNPLDLWRQHIHSWRPELERLANRRPNLAPGLRDLTAQDAYELLTEYGFPTGQRWGPTDAAIRAISIQSWQHESLHLITAGAHGARLAVLLEKLLPGADDDAYRRAAEIARWAYRLPRLLADDLLPRLHADLQTVGLVALETWGRRIQQIQKISKTEGYDLFQAAGRTEEQVEEVVHIQACRRREDLLIYNRPDPETLELEQKGRLDLLWRRCRRRERARVRRARERIALLFGLVGAGPSQIPICSRQTRADRVIQLRRQEEWIADREIVDTETGELIPFANVASLARRRQRTLAEVVTISRGVSDLAQDAGAMWVMITITCPPEYHPSPAVGQNRWDPALTPRDAADWLQTRWVRIRARLAKKQITPAGIRVIEPHRDGTPHAHILLYARPGEIPAIRRIAHAVAGPEPSVVIQTYDPAHPNAATGASYVHKYLLKTLAGDGTEADPYDAWASAWGIRRRSWVGVPGVTGWRLCRRARQAAAGDAEAARILGELLTAAQEGRGADWIRIAGGLGRRRQHRPIFLIYDTPPGSETRRAVGIGISVTSLRGEEHTAMTKVIQFGRWLPLPNRPRQQARRRLHLDPIVQGGGDTDPPRPPPDPGPAPPPAEAA